MNHSEINSGSIYAYKKPRHSQSVTGFRVNMKKFITLTFFSIPFLSMPIFAETYFCKASIRHFCQSNSLCESKNDQNPSEYRIEESGFKTAVIITKYIADKKISSWSSKQVVSNNGANIYVELAKPHTVLTFDKSKMKFSLGFTNSDSKEIWHQLELGDCK